MLELFSLLVLEHRHTTVLLLALLNAQRQFKFEGIQGVQSNNKVDELVKVSSSPNTRMDRESAQEEQKQVQQ